MRGHVQGVARPHGRTSLPAELYGQDGRTYILRVFAKSEKWQLGRGRGMYTKQSKNLWNPLKKLHTF